MHVLVKKNISRKNEPLFYAVRNIGTSINIVIISFKPVLGSRCNTDFH